MNIKRFTAPTSREALAKARMAFGEGTLILSNRPTESGVEVVATGEDTLTSLDLGAPTQPLPAEDPVRAIQADNEAPASSKMLAAPSGVAEDTEQLAMSTLSFQDYVRERMLRRRHESLHGKPDAAAAQRAANGLPSAQATQAARAAQAALQAAQPAVPRHNPLRPQIEALAPAATPAATSAPAQRTTAKPITPPAAPRISAPAAPSMESHHVLKEINAMKDLIEERFNTLSWLNQAQQNPTHSGLMLKMVRAGYSPILARAVLERLPMGVSTLDADKWLQEVLAHNLKTDAQAPSLQEEGGVFALVGSTGVGKTTTIAKLAALCARTYGNQSVGLITLDTYRVGAHEQLRSYGRMLGVVAHLAHDRDALQDLMGLLSNKKMVLIDTTGIAPRDPRKQEMLDLLDLPGIKRLLVLNAGSHGDTLDNMLGAFKTSGSQQAILSKVDEAVKLGPAVDALIRHQMVLRGVTNGQRVPEDWSSADATQLIHETMRSPVRSAFDPQTMDLPFFFTPPANVRGEVESFHA